MATVRVYKQGNYLVFEHSPINKSYFVKSERFHLHTITDYISIYAISQSSFFRQIPYKILRATHWSEFQDEAGDPLGANQQEVINYLTSGLGIGSSGFQYIADTYDDLVAASAGSAAPLDLAYVRYPQGTEWLPGDMGGTYYPAGIYLFDGGEWVSNRNDIASAIQALILEDQETQEQLDDIVDDIDAILDIIANLNADQIAETANRRFVTGDQKDALQGTNGTPSGSNRYVTDSDPRNTNARTPTPHTHPVSDITGLSTTVVPEGSNLYFTVARVLATVLTGLAIPAPSAIAATDTILQAFGKLQAQINSLVSQVSAIAALTPTAGEKQALAGNSGAPSNVNRYVTEAGLSAALTQAGTPVTRPINATPFIPSATKYVRGSYTVQIAATINLSGAQTGTVFLETFNGSTWDEVARTTFGFSGGVVIGLNLTATTANQLNGFFQPNQQVRLRTTGNATVTYIAGQESTIG